MLVEFATTEERFIEIKKLFPNAVSVEMEIEEWMKDEKWIKVVFNIENYTDAVRLFHAGINYGTSLFSKLVN